MNGEMLITVENLQEHDLEGGSQMLAWRERTARSHMGAEVHPA